MCQTVTQKCSFRNPEFLNICSNAHNLNTKNEDRGNDENNEKIMVEKEYFQSER